MKDIMLSKEGTNMNELNIYARYNYKKLVKQANLHFNKQYCWRRPQTVFAPYDGKFMIAIRKHNIHLSYWDEETEQGCKDKEKLKSFLEENVKDMTIFLQCSQQCDITEMLTKNNDLL